MPKDCRIALLHKGGKLMRFYFNEKMGLSVTTSLTITANGFHIVRREQVEPLTTMG